MLDYTQITASSLEGLNQEYLSITRNLANVGTVGYKRRRNAFAEVLSAQQSSSPTPGAGSIETTAGVDFSQGGLTQTGRTLDLALAGKGFFVVETPEGNLYTRKGTFKLNENRQLVDAGQRIVAGESGAISVPANVSTLDIQVAKDGSVLVSGQAIGKLKLVDFEKPQELEPYGGDYFRAGLAQEQRPTELRVQQGFYESSNVNAVEELVNLIMVSRVYEANIKSITTQDEQMQNILQVAMS